MFTAEFASQVAVVTGGSSGIGEACVRKLHHLGVSVVFLDLDEDRGRSLAEELSDGGAGIRFRNIDITDGTALNHLADELRSDFSRLDILINCAGIGSPNVPAEELRASHFRTTFEVNCLGTFLVCQAFFPLLSERSESGGASIANVASQAALVSLPRQGAYSASKAALAGLTRSLAVDWGRYNIRVNAVCPGFTLSPPLKAALTDSLRDVVGRRVPLGRLFEPIEVANALVFLVSPLASAITGVSLPVDGGWTAGEGWLPSW